MKGVLFLGKVHQLQNGHKKQIFQIGKISIYERLKVSRMVKGGGHIHIRKQVNLQIPDHYTEHLPLLNSNLSTNLANQSMYQNLLICPSLHMLQPHSFPQITHIMESPLLLLMASRCLVLRQIPTLSPKFVHQQHTDHIMM